MIEKFELEEKTTQESLGKQIFKKKGKKPNKPIKILRLIFILAIIIGGIGGTFIYLNLKDLLVEKTALQKNFTDLKAAANEQNLVKIQKVVDETRKTLIRIETRSNRIFWARPLPVAGNYVADLKHGTKAGVAGLEATELAIEAIMPYTDILGLAGSESATSSGKTTMDRITFVLTTLDKVKPQFEKINEKLKIVKEEISQIDPRRYPKEFQGMKVREWLTAGIAASDQATALMGDARPLLEVLPSLLGMESEKYYLIIFQNDAELRPTGGFMTAYGILKVAKGKITPVISQDIYSLDNQLKKTESAPEILIKYIKFPYGEEKAKGLKPQWRLRDMNLSPDFAVSMEKFYGYYRKLVGEGKINGIIGIDTKVLVRLLQALGPVGVPEWGNFSAENDKRCNCPQVVYQLELLADKPISGTNLSRKAVIGPLMHSVLLNAFQSSKAKMPLLVEAGSKSVYEKDVLLYLFDEKAQKVVEALNLGGRIRDYAGDYFHLNDANFGGAKSNLFIKYQVEQKVEIDNEGNITRTVAITYKNPAPASNCNLEKGELCLNGLYRGLVRIYVPKGSLLVESNGLEGEVKTSEDLGKTVFEGFYGDKYPLRPQSSTKVTFKYKLPFQVKKNQDYKLLIQKQPGVGSYSYAFDFAGSVQEFELSTDKELSFKN